MARPDNPHKKNRQSASPNAEINSGKAGAFGGNGGTRADAQSSGGTGSHGAAAQAPEATSAGAPAPAADLRFDHFLHGFFHGYLYSILDGCLQLPVGPGILASARDRLLNGLLEGLF